MAPSPLGVPHMISGTFHWSPQPTVCDAFPRPIPAHSVSVLLPRPGCRDLSLPCVPPQVPRSEANTFSASHHVAYFEASAKLRLNVDEAFEQLVRAVR